MTTLLPHEKLGEFMCSIGWRGDFGDAQWSNLKRVLDDGSLAALIRSEVTPAPSSSAMAAAREVIRKTINDWCPTKAGIDRVFFAEAMEKALAPYLQHMNQAMPAIPDYRGFALGLFEMTDWPEGGDIDGFDFQDTAERHGLLKAEQRVAPCGEDCWCAEYSDATGETTCLRKHPDLIAAAQLPKGEG